MTRDLITIRTRSIFLREESMEWQFEGERLNTESAPFLSQPEAVPCDLVTDSDRTFHAVVELLAASGQAVDFVLQQVEGRHTT
jgi:hypothetical protein